MSKYTTEVRDVCEFYSGIPAASPYDQIELAIEGSVENIFDRSWDVINEDHRMDLCKHILSHYYEYEINMTTVASWKLSLNNKMMDIMPRYNKLYETADMEFDIFEDVNYTEDITSDGTDNDVYSGSDSRTHTGDVTDTKSGTDTITTDIDDDITKTGNDELQRRGTDSNAKTGNDKTEKGGYDTTTSSDVKWDFNNETPQSKIQSLNVGSNDTMTNIYLTDYQKETDNATNRTDYHSNSTTTYNSTETATYNSNDKTVYNSNTNETAHNTSETEYDSSNVKSFDDAITDTYGKHINNTSHNRTIKNVKGKMSPTKSNAKMLEEYRNTILNIDMMIIRDLRECFFLMW